jgi:hypothetical protein
MKPQAETLRHLIAHVKGQGERGWYQGEWTATTDEEDSGMDGPEWIEPDLMLEAEGEGQAAIVEGCNAYACIAGEVLLFNGYDNPEDVGIHASLGDKLWWEDAACWLWEDAACWLGVDRRMLTMSPRLDLFSPARNKGEILKELEYRLAAIA